MCIYIVLGIFVSIASCENCFDIVAMLQSISSGSQGSDFTQHTERSAPLTSSSLCETKITLEFKPKAFEWIFQILHIIEHICRWKHLLPDFVAAMKYGKVNQIIHEKSAKIISRPPWNYHSYFIYASLCKGDCDKVRVSLFESPCRRAEGSFFFTVKHDRTWEPCNCHAKRHFWNLDEFDETAETFNCLSPLFWQS